MNQNAKLEKEGILELAKTNPIVQAALAAWRIGLVSLEDAMIECVAILGKQNSKLEKAANRNFQLAPPVPIILQVSQETFDRVKNGGIPALTHKD